MDKRYVVFDVETPNSRNDRISSIGITVVEAGEIVQEFYTLADPETEFHYYNVALTGITPDMVRGKPNFPALWQEIEPIMSSGLLVAHNAPFDMSVLAKCLRDYGIAWKRRVAYSCTCQMGRRLLREMPNHRLDTLCYYMDIPLDHHDAGSDSRACAQLLRHYLQSGAELKSFEREYDICAVCTCRK